MFCLHFTECDAVDCSRNSRVCLSHLTRRLMVSLSATRLPVLHRLDLDPIILSSSLLRSSAMPETSSKELCELTSFSSSPDDPPRSQFTYRHLSQLSKSSVDCPFRIISHIDLDAFYAQCEMNRLGLPKDEPLAVQQWVG